MVVFQIWSFLVSKFRSFDPLHPFVPLLQQHNEYYTTTKYYNHTTYWLQLPSPFFAMLLYGVYKGPGWVKFGIIYPTYPPFWDKSPFYGKKTLRTWEYHNQSQQLRYGLLVIFSPLKLLPLLIVLLVLLHSIAFRDFRRVTNKWHATPYKPRQLRQHTCW